VNDWQYYYMSDCTLSRANMCFYLRTVKLVLADTCGLAINVQDDARMLEEGWSKRLQESLLH
jgi:hypothetical protein